MDQVSISSIARKKEAGPTVEPTPSDDDEQIDQLVSDDNLPTSTPKARVSSQPPDSSIPDTSERQSAGGTSEPVPLYVQPSSAEQRALKAAFDKLSAVVKSTAEETNLSAENIIFHWITQRTLITNATKKVKGGKLSSVRDTQRGIAAATVSQKPVRQKTSSALSIQRELRDLICEKADEIELPVTASNGLQWSTLLDIMAENGYYFDNYLDITVPGSTKSAGRKKGIREVPSEEQRTLFDAMRATNHQCTFKPYKSRSPVDIKALQESKAPVIIFAPPTGASEFKRGKRYFINGNSDFEGYQKCLEHAGCKGRLTMEKAQSTLSSATASNLSQPEEETISPMLRSRSKPTSVGARKVSPAQADEGTGAQQREEADTRQEQESTTVNVKRRRINNPDRSSNDGSAMPLRERVGIPYSMPLEAHLPRPDYHSAPSMPNPMDHDEAIRTSRPILSPPPSDTNRGMSMPGPSFIAGLPSSTHHPLPPGRMYEPRRYGSHPDEQLFNEHHRFHQEGLSRYNDYPSHYLEYQFHHPDYRPHYRPPHHSEHQPYYMAYPSHYPEYPSRFAEYPSGPGNTKNQSRP